MNAGIWHELGIEPTQDAGLIRQAYAARLKATRPDADPAGFARLRAAFEAALRSARGPSPPQPIVFQRPPQEVDAAETRLAAPLVEAALIERRMSEGDLAGASDALAAAIAGSTLPLGIEISLKDRLLAALIDDRRLTGEALIACARQFGWDDVHAASTAGGDSAQLRTLYGKLEAERWSDGVTAAADDGRYRLGDETAAAARILTRRPEPLARLLPPVPELTRQLALYRFHARWIAHRFDAGAVETAEKLAERPYPGRLARALWSFVWTTALTSMVAASSLVLMPLLLGIPYLHMKGFSRPALFAYGTMTLVFTPLCAVLPSSIFLLHDTGDNQGSLIGLGWLIVALIVIAIKQLFIPRRRTR